MYYVVQRYDIVCFVSPYTTLHATLHATHQATHHIMLTVPYHIIPFQTIYHTIPHYLILYRTMYTGISQSSLWYRIATPGLRGAVAFSLSTQLQFGAEQRSVLVTSTLIIVLFTILIFGGSTLPLLKVI